MDIKEKINSLLEEYIEAPEAWSDDVMVEVNPSSLDVRLCDDEDVDVDNSELDYWPVMDLLQVSVSHPGEWEIDSEALSEMAAEYAK